MGVKPIAVAVGLMLVGISCGGGAESGTTPTEVAETVAVSVPMTTTTAQAPATTEAAAPPPIELVGTSWTVKDYSRGAGIITNVWKTDVTIAFDDQTVSGSAGCNTYTAGWSTSGTYDPHVPGQPDANDGQAIAFDDLSWTEIACDNADIMEQEVEILALLQATARWIVRSDHGTLSLRDGEGNFLLRADPVG